jgi:hypothetical protein
MRVPFLLHHCSIFTARFYNFLLGDKFILWGGFIVTIQIRFTLYTSFIAVIICSLEDGHSDWGEMEPQGSFDLHFFYG